MKQLTAFVRDLLADNKKQQLLGLGEQQLLTMLAEAESDGYRTWLTVSPSNDDHINIAQGLGVFASYYQDKDFINRPRCLRQVGAEIWIGNQYQRIARVDSNGSFLGFWCGLWSDPRHSDGYHYPSAFAVDRERDRIYIALDRYHMVRAFTLSTGQLLWQFGSGYAGNLADNKLYSPHDVDVLANGNVLVCSYNGFGVMDGVTATHHGHISELDANTGELIACRIMYRPNTTGAAWDNACFNPTQARILNDGLLYVSMYHSDHIGVWDPDTWQYVTSYTKPRGVDIGSVNPRGLTLNSDKSELIVAANSPKKVVALGLDDHDAHWSAGSQHWDDKAKAENRIGGFQDLYDVLALPDNRYAVADFGNNRIMIVPSYNTVGITYDVTTPKGYKIVHAPKGFNSQTNTLHLPISQLDQVGSIQLMLEAAHDF